MTANERTHVPPDRNCCTHIGRVCNTESSSRDGPRGLCLLITATTTRSFGRDRRQGLAAVPGSDREQLNNPEASGLTAGWLPRDMGKEGSRSGWSTGKDTFSGPVFAGCSSTRASCGRDVPEGGQFPPFRSSPVDVDDCEAITTNADALALALPRRSGDGDFAPGVTIFLPRGEH